MTNEPRVVLTELPRAERSRSARALCSRCRKPIDKGVFRVVVPGEIMAIGYQHVACAAAERKDLDVVIKHSALSSEEAAALRAEWPTTKAPTPAPAPEPIVEHDSDLVAADDLVQRNDPRGELIVVTHELRNGARPELLERAHELSKQALTLWKKELDGPSMKVTALEEALPVVRWSPKRGASVDTLFASKLVRRVAVTGNAAAIDAVLKHAGFRQVIDLRIRELPKGFASRPKLATLRSLEVTGDLRLRDVHELLTATAPAKLARLTLRGGVVKTADVAIFRSVDGLPALRSLLLSIEIYFGPRGLVPSLLVSPLVARLVELGGVHPNELARVTLPHLRKAIIELPAHLGALAVSEGLPNLEALEVLVSSGADVLPLAKTTLPKLSRIVLRGTVGRAVRSALAKRFGDGLV